MTTRELFREAYSAAREAEHFNHHSDDGYRSPLSAALNRTAVHHRPERYRVCMAAVKAAEMKRSYRLRRSIPLAIDMSLSIRLSQLGK